MMNMYYFYFLSFFYLLLITEWTHAGSLRSLSHSTSIVDRRQPPLNVDIDMTTSEPVLFRRRPILISNKRRRWLKDDEVEIPLDETYNNLSTNTLIISDTSTVLLSDPIPSNNATFEIKHTVIGDEEEIIETNITNIEQSTDKQILLTTSELIVDDNVTENDRLSTDQSNFNQTISNETNDTIIDNLTTIESTKNNQIETTVIEEISMPNTAITLLDYTATVPSDIDANQTLTDTQTDIIQENTTIINNGGIDITTTLNEMISTEETINNIIQNSTEDQMIINTTIISESNQNDTQVTDQGIVDTTMSLDIIQNDISTIVDDVDEYSNETTQFVPTNPTKPVCDQSCQCLRKCHYGFEIINGTCHCDEPCKNYQCFQNDTCSVSKDGKPHCQLGNGSVHDRPFRCYQARDAGYHDENVRYYNRWYYNANQDTCHLFVYRGMGGNENNFQTLHECHLECITCAPSSDRGTCLGHLSMWYYDRKKNQCSQFIYSGCKGNENKFIRKQDCIDTCITRIVNL